MADYGKVLGALVLGAVAGVTLGVLFAPDKGSNTRKKIANQTNDLIDQLSDKIEEGKSALSDLQKKASQKAEGIKSKMSSMMDEEEESIRHKAKTANSH